MPYAGDKQWTRPAGHVSVAAEHRRQGGPLPAPGSGCDYKLDVTGGWYDAGDHGKYVVNGGIAAWTMMNQYERAPARGTGGDFADGKMNIPEKKNKVPDMLDEARWEMEFMLKMQVPDGQPKAGMVAPQDPRQGVDRARHRAPTRTRSRASSGRRRRRRR